MGWESIDIEVIIN